MQNTSATYGALLADSDARKEVKVVIAGGDYGEDRLVALSTRSTLFADNGPGIGGALSREIDLEVRDPGSIPRMAEMDVYVRLKKGETVSEWLPKGVFFINTRERNTESGTLIIHGYDAMLKTAKAYIQTEEQGQWPKTDRAVVDEICQRIGVSLDSRTAAMLTKRYSVQYPGYGEDGYTMREVLGYIGAMYGGNWIMSDAGELMLLTLGGIPEETHYLIEEHGAAIVLGGVRLLV